MDELAELRRDERGLTTIIRSAQRRPRLDAEERGALSEVKDHRRTVRVRIRELEREEKS